MHAPLNIAGMEKNMISSDQAKSMAKKLRAALNASEVDVTHGKLWNLLRPPLGLSIGTLRFPPLNGQLRMPLSSPHVIP